MADNWMVVLLLGLNTFFVGLTGYFLQRYVKQNDDHHKMFFDVRDKFISMETEHRQNHPAIDRRKSR